MTARQRTIAAAPVRGPAETWLAIEQLVISTLGKADGLVPADVGSELRALRPVGAMLVAGGHLERAGLELIAASLELTITTVSGSGALALVENLNAVPGTADATSWALYVPDTAPLSQWVIDAIKGQPHLHAASEARARAVPPVAETEAAIVVDLAAFSRRKEGP